MAPTRCTSWPPIPRRRIRQLSLFYGDAWANPEAYTEAAWVGRALADDWPSQLAELEPRHGDQGLPLVCRPGLELHTGTAGLYRERHGNLRTGGGQAVLRFRGTSVAAPDNHQAASTSS